MLFLDSSKDEVRGDQGAYLSYEEISANINKILPIISASSSEIDKSGTIPLTIIELLRKAGAFRLCMPRSWGGPEMHISQIAELIERITTADASVGWCVMIGCAAGFYASFLPEETAQSIFDLDTISGGMVEPLGRGKHVPGGFRITGNWKCASGSNHLDVFLAGFWVPDDGLEEKSGEWRIAVCERTDFEILDTWDTIGLRGTGSNDYQCTDLFVPTERTFSFTDGSREGGTLYRSPEFIIRKFPATALGMARSAIDQAKKIIEKKCNRGVPYREMADVQIAVAEAESLYQASKAYYINSLEAQWASFDNGNSPNAAERANIWLSRWRTFKDCRTAIRLLYETLGTGVVYSKTPIERSLRNIETAAQHAAVQKRYLAGVGQLLLGTEPKDQYYFFL